MWLEKDECKYTQMLTTVITKVRVVIRIPISANAAWVAPWSFLFLNHTLLMIAWMTGWQERHYFHCVYSPPHQILLPNQLDWFNIFKILYITKPNLPETGWHLHHDQARATPLLPSCPGQADTTEHFNMVLVQSEDESVTNQSPKVLLFKYVSFFLVLCSLLRGHW